MPYIWLVVHGLVFTPTFQSDIRKARLSEGEVMEIVAAIAADPLGGGRMAGTGGARKVRHPGRGKGKSGGYRTVHYFGGNDVPVFMLALYGKGEKDNLSKAERNALAAVLPKIADAYRKETRK
ncbi:MAG TPA: type II toxin-antitoxin system RelE/ParE family toxin [Bauldia sp.]|nr:type II toxin-antitoxin system RelE/ParE family toxin [Bauldia sp.]